MNRWSEASFTYSQVIGFSFCNVRLRLRKDVKGDVQMFLWVTVGQSPLPGVSSKIIIHTNSNGPANKYPQHNAQAKIVSTKFLCKPSFWKEEKLSWLAWWPVVTLYFSELPVPKCLLTLLKHTLSHVQKKCDGRWADGPLESSCLLIPAETSLPPFLPLHTPGFSFLHLI